MFYDYSTKDALNVTGKGSKKGAKIFKRKLRSLLVFTIAFVMALSPLFSSGPISFAADSYPVVLGFTSDVHQNNTNLTQWLTSIKNKGIELDRMTFGGDYNVGYSGDAEAITTRNAASAVLGSEVPITLVRGNHETTDSSLFAKGLVYNGEAYAMFALDTSGESFLDSDMTALSNALASILSSKPVFVMTHRPIHYYGMRTTLKASQMINLLNDYENVIFLWGHNHTVMDTNYGVIKYKGDKVQTTNGGPQEEINFTYLSFGAMKDGNNSAYGLVVTLNKVGNDTKVDFSYRDLQGNQQQTGSVTISGSGGSGPSEPGGAAGYKLVSSPENGETYVVVAKSGSTNYALSTEKFTSGSNDYLRGKQVTVVDDKVLANTVDSSMLWKFVNHTKGFNVLNGSSNFLYRKNQGGEGIYINGDGSDDNYADWIYNSAEKSLRSETTNVSTDNIFYILLGNSGSNFYFSNNLSSKSEIFLYKLIEIEEPEEEQPEEEQPEEEEPEEEQPKDETPQQSRGRRDDDRVKGVADEPVPEAVPYKGFSDVKEDDWFFEAVKFVNERELFKGVSNELFAPNVNITRGMFVTILSRFEFGNDESVPQGESPFEDLTQDWYKNAVAWAFANEITLGVSETNFAPDQILTREQMVTLIFRYAEMKGFDIGFEQEAAEIFEDFVSINEYAKPAMLWAFKHGLLVDINAESLIFNPQNNASRALSAYIFMRFYKETLEP
ncbi:MAG: S-layer homology domain-containing protein [Gudongella sp.]|jgi:hypothetical protein|nr:S-layer homology domain-containing protein [Gudongella sp.]